ncbi:MAG TPA: hypothetical protein VFX59_31395 [Polyangiales bacterium]|nr:hypothetical protein [Polyangiales bacterium]
MRSWSLISFVFTVLALVSCAAPPRAASQALRSSAGSYELEVLVNGEPVRTFAHRGQTYVLGQEGDRYVLRIHNRSARRIEAVVTVDGLDVIDGEQGDFATKRGYLVPAYGSVDIEGWRVSNEQAAAFRFAPIGESYAAKTGRARNVGVIGMAVFPERVIERPRPRPVAPVPYYYERESRAAGSADKSAQVAPAAPAAEEARDDAAPAKGSVRRERSGLGTEYGEALYSQIEHVSFTRANATRPAVLLGARYNDRRGLITLGIDVDAGSDVALRESASPFPASGHYARPPRDWRGY